MPMRRESSTVVVLVGEVGDVLLAGLGWLPGETSGSSYPTIT